jgi:hypothetical protein
MGERAGGPNYMKNISETIKFFKAYKKSDQATEEGIKLSDVLLEITKERAKEQKNKTPNKLKS